MKKSKFQIELEIVKSSKNLLLLVGIDKFIILKYEQDSDTIPSMFLKGSKDDDIFSLSAKYLKVVLDSVLCESLSKINQDDRIPDIYFQPVAEHFAQKFSTEEKKMGTIHNSVDESIYNLLKVSELEVVIGDAIITEDIKNRVKNIRRNIAEETGFIFQDVLIKNDQSMGIEYYQILYKGIEITSGKINPEKFLVVSIADLGNLFGINGFYPDEGSWVKDSENDIEGITTVDPTSLIALHLYETIKKISHELMTKESVQLLINNLEILHPITVKDCLEVAPISLVQKVLRKLLHDNIPIKDMVTILETITDYAGSKNIDVIVEAVRKALSRVITNMYKKDNKLDIITLSQEAEQHLLQSTTNQNGTNVLSINVPQINKLVQMSMAVINELSKRGDRAVLIVDPMIRKSIADIYNSFDLDIVVLSHSEVETTVQFDRKAIIDTEF